jgi:hypothetical protein
MPGFSHQRITRVIMHEACNSGKVSTGNMNDIMIDRERELWFESEDFVERSKKCTGGPSNQG